MNSNENFWRLEFFMRAAWWKSLIIYGVSLVAGIQTHAQPLSAHAESIESTVANADLVFIAKLEKFDDVDKSGRTTRSGEREWHNTTIAIEETLKQDLPGRDPTTEPYRGLQVHISRPASVLVDWQKRSCRLLVAIDGGVPNATTVIELMPARMEVLTADFELLKDSESVLRAAMEALHRMPAAVKRIHTYNLEVPREIVARTSWDPVYNTGGYLTLSVPVDQKLEKRARDYIRSGSSRRRAEGARTLVYFKSDENISLVRQLLDDPENYVVPAYQDHPAIRKYYVRSEAYGTLKRWGIDVKEPVICEEVRK